MKNKNKSKSQESLDYNLTIFTLHVIDGYLKGDFTEDEILIETREIIKKEGSNTILELTREMVRDFQTMKIIYPELRI
ncbi:hypothetical protein TetV_648 [Tetraselmis virus 1]|uniref:Uncharacterized protein n=1 Tax=Tetraselmis virus 1 TaxID=2060617 RepID=A0A2P0VPB4_9VIRU|nr:hypothetical protein QJ968_gp406 [Tetraselmis virus 1]AUF82730.1 hypothetical protein TetV_648 [Tetraselmis virus 1]